MHGCIAMRRTTSMRARSGERWNGCIGGVLEDSGKNKVLVPAIGSMTDCLPVDQSLHNHHHHHTTTQSDHIHHTTPTPLQPPFHPLHPPPPPSPLSALAPLSLVPLPPRSYPFLSAHRLQYNVASHIPNIAFHVAYIPPRDHRTLRPRRAHPSGHQQQRSIFVPQTSPIRCLHLCFDEFPHTFAGQTTSSPPAQTSRLLSVQRPTIPIRAQHTQYTERQAHRRLARLAKDISKPFRR